MVKHGLEIAPDGLFAEQQDYCDVVLEQRLHAALVLLNPNFPVEALQNAYHRLSHPQGADLISCNYDGIELFLADITALQYRVVLPLSFRKDFHFGAHPPT